jgi:uncharacterized protein (DUF488 family)
MPPLYTIGYQGRSLEEFLAVLRREGIGCVVDVRRNALSRKPGFSKTALREALAGAGIDYLHLRRLGIESAQRKGLKTDEDYARLFRQYKKTVLPITDKEINIVYDIIVKERTALLCYEYDHNYCHRAVVGRYICKLKECTLHHIQQ